MSNTKPKKKVKKTEMDSSSSSIEKTIKKKIDWVPNPQKDFGQENVDCGRWAGEWILFAT